VLDSGAEGPGFKSQSRHRRITVLRKLFTPIVSVHQAAKLVAALLRVAGVTAGLAESNGSLAYRPVGSMTDVTCRLTAKNRISSGTLRSAIEYGRPLPLRTSTVFRCAAKTAKYLQISQTWSDDVILHNSRRTSLLPVEFRKAAAVMANFR